MRIGDEQGLRVAPSAGLRADFPGWDSNHADSTQRDSESLFDQHLQDMERLSDHMAFSENDAPPANLDVVQVNYDRWSNLNMARVKNPDSTLLALAEHYAYARWDASSRASGIAVQALIVPGYTGAKAIFPNAFQIGEAPPTPASAAELIWGWLGALAGLYDYLRKRESWETFREGVDHATERIREGKAERVDDTTKEARDFSSGKRWS